MTSMKKKDEQCELHLFIVTIHDSHLKLLNSCFYCFKRDMNVIVSLSGVTRKGIRSRGDGGDLEAEPITTGTINWGMDSSGQRWAIFSIFQ